MGQHEEGARGAAPGSGEHGEAEEPRFGMQGEVGLPQGRGNERRPEAPEAAGGGEAEGGSGG